MKVLVVGSGGREHALAHFLAQEAQVREVLIAPGNGGTHTCARSIITRTKEELVRETVAEKVDLVVIGPEAPLAEGLADDVRSVGIPVFGPGRVGARLEASKAFAKEFMARHRVPTATYGTFTDLREALGYLHEHGAPIVVKDSFLAAGKGVTVAHELHVAEEALHTLFQRPNAEVVLEEFLEGQELSVHVVTDGRHAITLPLAQDHKQIGEGDTGPMTGGMGAVAPVPLLTPQQEQDLEGLLIAPVLRGLEREGIAYKGALFLGVMWTQQGPKLLEINVRFGDPETQTILPLLDGSLLNLFDAVERQTLDTWTPAWKTGTVAATVVLAAPGYPGTYPKDLPIHLPASRESDTWIFHAGTRTHGGATLSTGGRILAVTALDATLERAVAKAYREVDRIAVPGGVTRRDIGGRFLV